MLPWLAFAGVAALLVALWRFDAPDVSWIRGWSLAAVIVAVVAFPLGPLFGVWLVNCGLSGRSRPEATRRIDSHRPLPDVQDRPFGRRHG